jgi:hypothetical protein
VRRLGWVDPEPDPEEQVRKELEARWARAQQALEVAGDYGRLPEAEYLYNLHIDVLKSRITANFTHLCEVEPLTSCLRIIEKLVQDPPAAFLGFAILHTALIARGCDAQAEALADLQAAYRLQWQGDPVAEPGADGPAQET